jgi:HEAT repeat protein
MTISIEEIRRVLIGESIPRKIDILSELVDTDNHEIISEIIKMLDDIEIQVRGEAFSTLVLNPKNISDILINHLESDNKNIRGFTILVLANRNDKTATKEIAKLTNDDNSMVRSCALGALGYLNAKEFSKNIHDCFSDSNIEVKRSAVYASILIGEKISPENISKLKKENDAEIEKILSMNN